MFRVRFRGRVRAREMISRARHYDESHIYTNHKHVRAALILTLTLTLTLTLSLTLTLTM